MGNPVYQKGPLLLAMLDNPVIDPPPLDEYFNPQAYVFLSRHSAESGIPSLTAHTTGNFSENAELGGRGMELGRSNPDLLKNYMIAISGRRHEVPAYEVTVEATHHGPTSLLKPVLFVEIGSTERNWGDGKAAATVTSALVESLEEPRHWESAAVCFGGTHYPSKFNRLILESDVAVAFVVPKYELGNVNEAMLGQMLQKSTTPVSRAVLDWKGLGQHKESISRVVDKFGLGVTRV